MLDGGNFNPDITALFVELREELKESDTEGSDTVPYLRKLLSSTKLGISPDVKLLAKLAEDFEQLQYCAEYKELLSEKEDVLKSIMQSAAVLILINRSKDK